VLPLGVLEFRRAGLWMIARSRDSIPPLPIEGRTSMDLPQGAERDFYGAIGYLPLGNHAIRADMVERLAAMARRRRFLGGRKLRALKDRSVAALARVNTEKSAAALKDAAENGDRYLKKIARAMV